MGWLQKNLLSSSDTACSQNVGSRELDFCGLYKLLLFLLEPDMSDRLIELQQGQKTNGVPWLRRRVNKIGFGALKSLASELGLVVEDIHVKKDLETLICAKLEMRDSVERLRSVLREDGRQMLWQNLKALKREDLRDMCKELQVTQRGQKDEVVQRIFQHLAAEDCADC